VQREDGLRAQVRSRGIGEVETLQPWPAVTGRRVSPGLPSSGIPAT